MITFNNILFNTSRMIFSKKGKLQLISFRVPHNIFMYRKRDSILSKKSGIYCYLSYSVNNKSKIKSFGNLSGAEGGARYSLFMRS